MNSDLAMKKVVGDTHGFNWSCCGLHVLSWHSPFLWVLWASCHTPGRCTPGHLMVDIAEGLCHVSRNSISTVFLCVACQTLLSAFLMTCDIKALCFWLVRRECLLLWAEPSAARALETERLVVCGGSSPIPCCDVCFLCSVPIFSPRAENCRRLLLA